ncbi:MAG: NUDIX hydrolase [Actinomycetota bacterium]
MGEVHGSTLSEVSPLGGYEVSESRLAFEGQVIRVRVDDVRFSDGSTGTREVVEHRGAVGALPVLPDGRVVLVRQYRHPVGGELIEIPAGKLDLDGEAVESCIRRELIEEVGFQAGRLLPAAVFYTTPGFSNELFHLFVALDLSPVAGAPGKHEEADMQVMILDMDAALDRVRSGEIRDAKTIIALTLGKEIVERERAAAG